MKQSVKRVNLTGNWQEVVFTNKASRYFVKNYSDDDIFVSFEANDSEDESFKIKSGIAEEVAISYYTKPDTTAYGVRGRYVTDKIYVKGTGEVEIQQLDVWGSN